MAKITSVRNPLVVRAVKVRDGHSRQGEFLLDGPNLLVAALAAGVRLKDVLYTDKFSQDNVAFMKQLRGESKRNFFQLSETVNAVISKISDTRNPQGVVALATYEPPGLDKFDFNRVIVVLDGVGDPGNMGTIIRTADAVGAGGVAVMPGSCGVYTPKVLRATVGSVFNVPIAFCTEQQLLVELQKRSIRLAVAVGSAKRDVFRSSISAPLALVLGNEAHGVGPSLMEAADMKIAIPIRGGAESLNVGAAAAVILYESFRQTLYGGPSHDNSGRE